MLAVRNSIAPLLIGAAALMFAGGVNGLILPVRGAQEGFSAFSLGLLGAGWAAGFIAGCLMVPGMVKRVGHIRAFGAMTALAGVSILLSAMLLDPWAWIPLRAIAGFCFAGAAQIMESWLNEASSPTNRGRVFGTYAMINLFSNTAGQMVLPLGDTGAETFFILGAIFYALALLPTALYATQAPQPLVTVKLDVKKLFANSPIAVVGVFLVGLANSTYGTLAAVYGNAIGMSITAIAVFVSVTLFGGAIAQVPVGYASDRVDRRFVLIAMSVGAVLTSVFFIVYAPRDTLTIFIAAGIFGAFIHVMYPLLVSHANDHAPEGDFLGTSSGLLLVLGIGSMVGPVVAGFAIDAGGPEGMFMTMAAAHVALIAYALWRISQREAVPTEERGHFIRLQVTRLATQGSMALNPAAIRQRFRRSGKDKN